jgi:hypothetical protein
MSVKTLVTTALVFVALAFGLGLGSLAVPAQAGEYYTRKRVNGVWMHGLFPRHHPTRTAQGETKASAASAEKPPQRIVTSVASAGDELAPSFQRALQARRALAASVAPAATMAAPVTKAAVSAPAPPAAAATSVSFSDEDRLLPLRRALEARAKTMAVSTAPWNRNIKAVTFNFETGLRTSIYNDGSVIEEHFHPDTTLTGSIKY